MQSLMFIRKGRLEWRQVTPPALHGESDALVRPFVAARCDGDAVFLFHDLSRLLRVGAALHVLDAGVCELGRNPFQGPFPYGHEAIGEVVAIGGAVSKVQLGQVVVIPWAVSCGDCATCARGLTSHCERSEHLVSGYGFGKPTGGWGGLVSDLVRVPYADHMLVPVPPEVDPIRLASASDNLPDAYRTVGPFLRARPGARVLVMGGDAKSIGIYAAGMAVALGASRVDYLDDNAARLTLAEAMGATPLFTSRREAWFRHGRPAAEGGYDIAVEASGRRAGIDYAMRSLAVGGVCTGVAFYFFKGTPLPLWRMYLKSTSFRTGLSHPSADIPAVIDLVRAGRFDPSKVTTVVGPWEDAPTVFLQRGTKAVVQRPRTTAPS